MQHLRPGHRVRALAPAVVALLVSACGADTALAPAPTLAPTLPSLDVAAAATPITGPLVNGASGLCLSVAGNKQASFVAVTLAACGDLTGQTWTVQGIDAIGTAATFGGAQCLDAWGASGRIGTQVGTYACVPTAANHRWTLTAAGELRGQNSYCLGPRGGTAAAGVVLELQTCTGASAQRFAPPPPPPPPAPPAPTGVPLVSASGSLCLETLGGSATKATALTVSPCVAGAPWQSWTAPAVGQKGNFRIFATQCLQSTGTAGTVGTWQSIWPCVATAPNHQWTLTAAGEMIGQNGLCMTVTPASPSPKLTLQGCDGRAEQRWSTTLPAPTPLPPIALPALASRVTALMGVTPSVPAVEAKGGAWTMYERMFRHYGDWHWTYGGTYWENVNVYDRAMIFYVWWARTGNPDYLTRANSYAVTYRTSYVEATGYRPAAHYTMLDGIALHYLVTGDPKSLTAVGRVADGFATPLYIQQLASVTSGLDNRVQARALTALLLAWHLKAPSAVGNNWEALVKQAASNIMISQGADGAYRWTGQCGFNKPWMVGMVNDALIRYDAAFPDARVLTSVKKAVDYLWAYDWNAQAGAFVTLDGVCVNLPWVNEDQTPVSEANMMTVDGFSYVALKTGDQRYNVVADSVFSQGVQKLYFTGAKSWNQAYTTSYRYLQHRW